ncbi:MAG: FAD:protein FMN transferase [Actinomycetota bacterium]
MRAERRFPAMGSEAHVVAIGDDASALVERARLRIERLEAVWSRFRPTSEISRLNAVAGVAVEVCTDTLTLVRCAIAGARFTHGAYDPTVLGAVLDADYDRTFETLATSPTPRVPRAWRSAADAIVLDAAASTVTLPEGAGFDPGGIGKGLAADLVVLDLLRAGADGACVNVGGDLRVQGRLGQTPWTIEVEDPFGGSPLAVLSLRAGAVATTSRLKRSWQGPDGRRHHLIDPRTGRPAACGLASATAVAAEAWQAEVAAKAAFLAEPERGISSLASLGVECLLVQDDGAVRASAGLGRFLVEGVPA